MLTGRYNYRTAGQRLNLPLEDQPELAQEPEISVQTAGDYWQSRDINSVADGDHAWNVEQVTLKINGGMNGYSDRLAYFMAAGMVDWQGGDEPPPPVDEPYPAHIMEAFKTTGCQEIREIDAAEIRLTYIYHRPEGL